jgi:hypothetical protein
MRSCIADTDGLPRADATWGDAVTVAVNVPIAKLTNLPELEPVDSAGLGAGIDSVFRQGVVRWDSGRRPAAFQMNVQQTQGAEFSDVLVGLEVALLEGDAVRRILHVWWPAGPRAGGLRHEVVYEDLEALRRLPKDGAGWSLRVRGKRDIAARAIVPATQPGASAPLTTTKYWSGERTLPAEVKPMPGPSPRRRWFRPGPADLPPDAPRDDSR